MKNKIAIILPVKGRPENIPIFYKYWKETTKGLSDVYIGLDIEDKSYFGIDIPKEFILIRRTEEKTVTKVNFISSQLINKYKYIGFVGDDVRLLTENWEQIIIDTFKKSGKYTIIYPNDLHQKDLKVTHPFMTSELISKLGYFFPTGFWHRKVDVCLKMIGEEINNNLFIDGNLIYLPNVIFEHFHPHNHKAVNDNTYDLAYSDEWSKHDQIEYSNFIDNRLKSDIDKLKINKINHINNIYKNINKGKYNDIEIISVNYNTPEYIYRQYFSIRNFISSDIKIRIIDGSDNKDYVDCFKELELFDNNFSVKRLGVNIHHGAGLHFGISTSKCNKILVIDSDVYIIKEGFIDELNKLYFDDCYGISKFEYVDNKGFNVNNNGIPYLHPRCALINKKEYLQFKPFKNHGSPCIDTMIEIKTKGLSYKLIDFKNLNDYIKTFNRGTVVRVGYKPQDYNKVDVNKLILEENQKNTIKVINNNFLIINVLTRTSNRPNYFKNCYNTIHNQTYKHINHIVSVDNNETFEYAKNYNNIEIVKVKYMSAGTFPTIPGPCFNSPWNLYFNELLNHTKEGYVIYIDDDDMFNKNNAIEIIVNNIKTIDDLLFWRVKFPNRLIPDETFWNLYKQGNPPILNQISTLGFSHHTKYNNNSKWNEYSGGDYRCALGLHKIIPNKIFINEPLTTLQRIVAGGHGKRDDLSNQIIQNKPKIINKGMQPDGGIRVG
jgi:hypothetical protein